MRTLGLKRMILRFQDAGWTGETSSGFIPRSTRMAVFRSRYQFPKYGIGDRSPAAVLVVRRRVACLDAIAEQSAEHARGCAFPGQRIEV